MKKKLVLWGAGKDQEKLLLAIELIEAESLVKIHSFPEAIATESLYNELMDKWRSGTEIVFPEGSNTIERPLSITDDILPEEIKVDRTDLIIRAKTEWQFVILSSKLFSMYKSELEDMTDKVKSMSAFESGVWEELKGFWSKVQQQSRERNLFREHANELRDGTNVLFDQLKALRKTLDKEFQSKSTETREVFMTKLDEIQKQIDKGLGLSPIFNELKKIQQDYRDTKFTKEDRNKVWNKLDAAFKQVKTKKYGTTEGAGETSALSRVQRRYQGLLSAIGKMESSISRDRSDIDYQGKIINETDGQLEAQIRQAKIKMIEERISSKEIKHKDMLKTKAELEKRIESLKKREAQQEEKKKINEVKEQVKERIAKEIEEKNVDNQKDDKVQAAAAIMSEATTKEVPLEKDAVEKVVEEKTEPESIVDAITSTVGESLENVVDTVKAVAGVVSEKIEDVIEEITESDDAKAEEE